MVSERSLNVECETFRGRNINVFTGNFLCSRCSKMYSVSNSKNLERNNDVDIAVHVCMNYRCLQSYLVTHMKKIFVVYFQIKRQDTASADIDEEIENYNYENPNDKENYCPKGDEVCYDLHIIPRSPEPLNLTLPDLSARQMLNFFIIMHLYKIIHKNFYLCIKSASQIYAKIGL